MQVLHLKEVLQDERVTSCADHEDKGVAHGVHGVDVSPFVQPRLVRGPPIVYPQQNILDRKEVLSCFVYLTSHTHTLCMSARSLVSRERHV